MSSLISEKPLLISPSLAATIGLEEATLLSALSELRHHRDAKECDTWLQVSEDLLSKHLPFWTAHDIQRISKSLRDKGIIDLDSAPYMNSRQLIFSFSGNQQNQKPEVNQNTLARNTPTRGANRIASNWQPSDDVLTQLAQRNIPKEFALQQLPEFITYWRERDEPSHAWGNKFLKNVVSAWRNHETAFHRKDLTGPMSTQWRPSEDAMDVLVKHASINQQFVEDAIPEFVLFWQERGDSSRTWNSKFIQHVRKQWNYYTATVENNSVPKPIAENWQPGEDVYDVLRLANIDLGFAKELVQEFVLFWRDSKQAYPSWNTKFLQHVKFHWAKQGFSANSEITTSNGKAPQKKQSTRERSLEQDLTDRSWAF